MHSLYGRHKRLSCKLLSSTEQNYSRRIPQSIMMLADLSDYTIHWQNTTLLTTTSTTTDNTTNELIQFAFANKSVFANLWRHFTALTYGVCVRYRFKSFVVKTKRHRAKEAANKRNERKNTKTSTAQTTINGFFSTSSSLLLCRFLYKFVSIFYRTRIRWIQCIIGWSWSCARALLLLFSYQCSILSSTVMYSGCKWFATPLTMLSSSPLSSPSSCRTNVMKCLYRSNVVALILFHGNHGNSIHSCDDSQPMAFSNLSSTRLDSTSFVTRRFVVSMSTCNTFDFFFRFIYHNPNLLVD